MTREYKKLIYWPPRKGDVFLSHSGDIAVATSDTHARDDAWCDDDKDEPFDWFMDDYTLVSRTTPEQPAIDYNDGKWHGWNGGECPVHPESEVEVRLRDRAEEYGDMIECAETWYWAHDGDDGDIIAFRVTKPYVEQKAPREGYVVATFFPTAREAKVAFPGSTPVHVREVLE